MVGKKMKRLSVTASLCLVFKGASADKMATAWLAQLVECQSVVLDAEGSSPRPDQPSGS